MKNLVVLMSGRGSNLRAIHAACLAGQWPAAIGAVVCNRPLAPGLALAAELGLHTVLIDHAGFTDRDAFDRALGDAIEPLAPDLIVMAGFMRILGPAFIERFAGRMINIHPSLLPSFPGLATHRAALAAGVFGGDSATWALVAALAGGTLAGHTAKPLAYYTNNLGGLLTVCAALQRHGVRRFVFSSSATVYGDPARLPITEDMPLTATNPYGQTKLMAEQMLRDLGVADPAWQTACLRYFNAAGAHPSGEIGEDHEPERHLIPLAIRAADGTEDALTVFGSDYDTPDGTCIRDYIHVTDLAQAHLLALQQMENGGDSSAYNLGNGNGYSVLEVIQCVERITGHPVPHAFGDRRPGDPGRLVGSSKKAMDELGWRPEFDSLEAIVETAWRWHESHPKGYR